MDKVRKVFNILGTVLLVILLAVVVVMFDARISGEAPNVFGYQIFRVSSGSMEPELLVGDVILVKQVQPEEVKMGDTVTYKGEEGDLADKFITHKVIATPQYVNGEYVFQTQGIANGAIADPLWDEDQLLGVMKCKVPFINGIYNFFLKPYGLITFVLIIVILFGYELISLIVSYNSLDETDDNDDSEEADEQEKNNSNEENNASDTEPDTT